MKITYTTWAGIVLLFATALARAADIPPSDFGRSLSELLNWSESHSSLVHAMRFEADARRQQVISAGALDDPMFRVEWEDIDRRNPTLSPNRVGNMKYTVTQALPLWGKQEIKTRAAQARADAADQVVVSTRAQLRAEIRQAYGLWSRALASVRINEEQAAVLRQMILSANQRYATGKAPQSEVLRLQMELSLLSNEALELQNAVGQSRAALASWLNVAPQALAGQPQKLSEFLSSVGAPSWQDAARTHNPDLAAARKEAEAASARLDLARLNSRPGLNVGVSAKQMGDRLSGYGLMLEVQIPLHQGAKTAEQNEATAMLLKAHADEETRLRAVEREVNQMIAVMTTAQRQIELLDKTLLPQAELTLQSALANYSAGRGEFFAMLEAQQQIHRLRQMRLQMEFDAFQSNSTLKKMLGDQ